MTYSHNSVRNNLKMTTASATKSIRLKKGATTPSPPSTPTTTTIITETATPTVNAHSNSIASSTNNNPHFHQQVLTTSPTQYAPITPNNRMQQNQQRLQSQSAGTNPRNRQQRQSPQQMGGGGFFFANNNRRNGGGGRSPQSSVAATATNNNIGCSVRQSPATILGGGFSPAAFGSARKQRRSPTTTTPLNSFGVGGKVSPQHLLIPTALTHFAGSKCFDAPAPTALPKPPQHWTLSKSEEKLGTSGAGPALRSLLRGDRCSASKVQQGGSGGYTVKSSKRNLLDDFDTHNLKLLLNVQS